jgi:tRNA(fMet)-specific endonuclease VapC
VRRGSPVRYVLDTNHASAFWLGRTPIVDRIESLARAELALALPSVGELWFMVYRSKRLAANRRGLMAILRDFTLLDFDAAAAVEFGRIKAELVERGTVIPAIDLQIAAIVRTGGVILLTADAHFSQVSGLLTENWLTVPER